jgi:hypothetical protein
MSERLTRPGAVSARGRAGGDPISPLSSGSTCTAITNSTAMPHTPFNAGGDPTAARAADRRRIANALPEAGPVEPESDIEENGTC